MEFSKLVFNFDATDSEDDDPDEDMPAVLYYDMTVLRHDRASRASAPSDSDDCCSRFKGSACGRSVISA